MPDRDMRVTALNIVKVGDVHLSQPVTQIAAASNEQPLEQHIRVCVAINVIRLDHRLGLKVRATFFVFCF